MLKSIKKYLMSTNMLCLKINITDFNFYLLIKSGCVYETRFENITETTWKHTLLTN